MIFCSTQTTMRTIRVVCAILQDPEHPGAILAAQRPLDASNLPGKWELPGGKIESGEDEIAALQREIQEELGVAISVGERLTPVSWSYPAFQVMLIPYLCRLNSTPLKQNEHHELRWVRLEDLDQLDWAPADGPILTELKSKFAI
jgi:8-oxo-dGTP diphosphatase